MDTERVDGQFVDSNVFFRDTFTYIASNDISPQNIPPPISLPVCIFGNGLGGLEAISIYLKEVQQLRYCDIARLLNRDDRTIWDACASAKQKLPDGFTRVESEQTIPLSLFSARHFSVLETITDYLQTNYHLRMCEIARILNKDQRTIWTVCSRLKKKRKNHAQNVVS